MHVMSAVNGGNFFAYVPLLGGPRSCQRITESNMCVGVMISGKCVCVLSANVIIFVLMQQRSVSIVAL